MEMFPLDQLLTFGSEAVIVILLLLVLLRLRTQLGLAPLYITLGVFQPIQVLLASSLYAEVLPGLVVSPGSVIMFSASLTAILLVYILEDALETRKVIYGILLANLTMTLLMYLFGQHLILPDTLNFLELPVAIFQQHARVLFSGTLMLFVDVLLIIFVYEIICRKIKNSHFLSLYLTIAIILVLDSLGFYTGAFFGQDNYSTILISGIAGKLGMALFFAAGATLYLRFFEPKDQITRPLQDVFYALTYRQKYELERARGEQAETRLEESEERFRAIFNAANDAFFIHDLETGEILDVSQKTCEMFGLTRAEALQSRVGNLSSGVPPYTQEEALAWLQKAAAGVPQLFEWRAKHTSGRLFWVEVNMCRARIGKEDRVIVTARDISERKQAAEQIKQINQGLSTLNRVILACTTTLDMDALLEKILDEALALTGLEGGMICLVTPDETLQLVAHRATSQATILDLTTHVIKVGDGLCGQCARDHQPRILSDRETVLESATQATVCHDDVCFHAAFPLVTGNRSVGVLCIFTRTEAKPEPDKLHLLETLCAPVAMAMENARLFAEKNQQTIELDEQVRQRTSELELKNRELEKFNKLFVNRELRIIELKKQLKGLENPGLPK